MAEPGKHLTKACEFCGNPYRQWGSNQKFCSASCNQRDWRSRNADRIAGHREKQKSKPKKPTVPKPKAIVTALCIGCMKEYARVRSSQIYCSNACSQMADLARKKRVGGPGKGWSGGTEKVPRTPCQLCGKPFYAPPVQRQRGGGKFCGNDCRVRHFANHPEMYPQTSHKRGRGGRRDDLGGRYFRSRWEANYGRYLNLLAANGYIKGWEYEVETFEFTSIRRGQRFYTPDFRVTLSDGSVEYHEVKGYMDSRSSTKLKRMKKFFPEVSIVLIDKDRYRDIASTAAKVVPNWE